MQCDNLVSIITSCYNSEKFIRETYDSILNQTHTNWEWIVIDDDSSDNTFSIIKNISLIDSRVYVYKNNQNEGAAYSRNIGIKLAKGDYMTFIDSDDLWYPCFLEKVLQFITNYNYIMVFTSYEIRDESLKKSYGTFHVSQKINFKQLLKGSPISCLTAFINIKSFPKFLMPGYSKRQDYGLWLRYLMQIDYAYGLNEVLAVYRKRKKSLSSNKFSVIIYQFLIYYDFLKFNFINSLFYTTTWFVNAFLKYARLRLFK